MLFPYTDMPPNSWLSPSLACSITVPLLVVIWPYPLRSPFPIQMSLWVFPPPRRRSARRGSQGEHSSVQLVDTTAGGRREPVGDECVHQACGRGAEKRSAESKRGTAMLPIGFVDRSRVIDEPTPEFPQQKFHGSKLTGCSCNFFANTV
jgi:hypothetical protein